MNASTPAPALVVRRQCLGPEPVAAFFTTVCRCVLHTAHGADFATPEVDHDTFTAYLALTARRALLAHDEPSAKG